MSALLSHLVLLSENIHLRKHFKENEKEMIKEDNIESKKGGRKMVCGMKGAVHSNTARRRVGRREKGGRAGVRCVCAHMCTVMWAVRAHSRVCIHVCRVHSHMWAVCAECGWSDWPPTCDSGHFFLLTAGHLSLGSQPLGASRTDVPARCGPEAWEKASLAPLCPP